MHELSIAQSIISIAEKALAGKEHGTVSAVRIQVGALSCIETDALNFSFSIIRANTLLENAVLDIEHIPGEAQCNGCGHTFEITAYGNECPSCNSHSLSILKGKEMKVINLVVEEK